MKLLWLIFAVVPGFALTAQTNPPPAESSLWAVPTISLKHTNTSDTNLDAIKAAALTNAGLTNAAAHPPANRPPKERPPTRIRSDHAEVDLKNRVVVYNGHVIVVDPEMTMNCDQLTASVPTNSTQVDHIIAKGKVKIEGTDNKGRPLNARGDMAIYDFNIVNGVTNKTMTLTGNVYIDSALGKGTADPIVWDLVNDKIHMENQDMQIQAEPKTTGTNGPAANPFGNKIP
ncbi:MAG: LptA/OstA family protein [Verrucomicrobiota bacterium]